MITMAVQQGVYKDVASTEWNGTIYAANSAHGATMALARKLIAAGCPDQPWQMVSPGSTAVRMYGRSIAWLAEHTLETRAGRLYVSKFNRNPRFPMRHEAPDGVEG